MMCAKWAFLRTPEVEQHGEHSPPDPGFSLTRHGDNYVKSPEEKSPGLCDPNRIQTYNLLIRSQMLYSIELWDQFRSNDLYFDSAYFVAPSSLRITIFFSLILAFFPESALR